MMVNLFDISRENKVKDYGFKIFHKKIDITKETRGFLLELKYEDELNDKSDSIEIKLYNKDFKFTKIFKRGDELKIQIGDLKSTTMYIDSVDVNIREVNIISVKALAVSTTFNSLLLEYSCSFKNISLRNLLRDALQKAGYARDYFYFVYMDGYLKDIQLKNITHMGVQIRNLLAQYAKRYNCFVKVTSENVIFANKEYFKLNQPVARKFIYEKDENRILKTNETDIFKNINIKDNFEQYEELELLYYDPRQARLKATRKLSGKEITGELKKTLNTKFLSEDDAKAIVYGIKHQNTRNITFSTKGHTSLVAGSVIELEGLDIYNGKYLIISAHSIFNKNNNWVTDLNIINLED